MNISLGVESEYESNMDFEDISELEPEDEEAAWEDFAASLPQSISVQQLQPLIGITKYHKPKTFNSLNEYILITNYRFN